MVVVLPLMLQCRPLSLAYRGWSNEVSGKCISINGVAWFASVANMVLDLSIILLPVPQLLKLHLSLRKKLQIVLMFSLGFL